MANNNLRNIRESQGISQTQLAKKIDMSCGYISDLENGRRNIERIQAATLNKLCAALNCTPEELMSAPEFEFDKYDRLIVDGFFYDLGKQKNVVLISSTLYWLPNSGTFDYVKNSGRKLAANLRKVPSNLTINDDSFYKQPDFDYALSNLCPRGGFNVKVGRAITPDELEDIKSRYDITAISGEYVNKKGAIFGEEYVKTYTVIVLTLAHPADALNVEAELMCEGIEAINGNVGKVSIRIK